MFNSLAYLQVLPIPGPYTVVHHCCSSRLQVVHNCQFQAYLQVIHDCWFKVHLQVHQFLVTISSILEQLKAHTKAYQKIVMRMSNKNEAVQLWICCHNAFMVCFDVSRVGH